MNRHDIRRKRLHSEHGQAMVEFMLSLMVLMIFVLFCFEMLMLLYTYNVLADAAKEGVRLAVVSGSNSGSQAVGPSAGSAVCYTNSGANNVSQIFQRVNYFANLTFHNISAMTVNLCYLDGNNVAPSRVQVTVQYAYTSYFNLPLTPTIYAAAEGRIVN